MLSISTPSLSKGNSVAISDHLAIPRSDLETTELPLG